MRPDDPVPEGALHADGHQPGTEDRDPRGGAAEDRLSTLSEAIQRDGG